jgi:EAL domain-containing protein (putative c-di-GMP-specific phosphodiesterase class I)/GGDEF domain-containing protein
MLYNISYETAGLIFTIVVAVHFFREDRLRNLQNALFGVFIVFIMLACFLNVVGAITISYAYLVPPFLNMVINQLFYFLQITLPVLLYLFVLNLTEMMTPRNKKIILWSLVPYGLEFVLWLANPFTGHFFYFTSDFLYYRGHLNWLLYVILFHYFLLTAGALFKYRKSLRRDQLYTISSFLVFTFIAVMVSKMFPHLLLTGFASSLALAMTYLTLKNPVETQDDITHAFNRTALSNVIKEREIIKGIEDFVVISLDDYNGISKLLGVERAHLLLQKWTDHLKEIARGAQVFRYSGDIFLVLFEKEKELKNFMELYQRRMVFPWNVGDMEATVPASIFYSKDIPSIRKEDRLALIIDQMISLGKEVGNRVVMPIDEAAIQNILRQYRVEQALRKALDEDKLDVYLQPVYCPASDMFVSAEALVRFQDEKLGIIKLTEFIPLAEKNGMITRIGRQVLKKVCQYVRDNGVIEDSGLKRIMIKLSVLEAMRTDLVKSVTDILEEFEIPSEFIGFEITETNSALGGDLFIKNMLDLVERGISFALDDFGTGYANLDSIIALPFRAVKLDSSLVSASKGNEKIFIVLSEHIRMFKRMGLRVIVEGVENQQHVDLIKELPVDLIQGFYYARPMPLAKAVDFVRTYNKGKADQGNQC